MMVVRASWWVDLKFVVDVLLQMRRGKVGANELAASKLAAVYSSHPRMFYCNQDKIEFRSDGSFFP